VFPVHTDNIEKDGCFRNDRWPCGIYCSTFPGARPRVHNWSKANHCAKTMASADGGLRGGSSPEFATLFHWNMPHCRCEAQRRILSPRRAPVERSVKNEVWIGKRSIVQKPRYVAATAKREERLRSIFRMILAILDHP
jgi:hypothetical protein